jgi:hypothetical protein
VIEDLLLHCMATLVNCNRDRAAVPAAPSNPRCQIKFFKYALVAEAAPFVQ